MFALNIQFSGTWKAVLLLRHWIQLTHAKLCSCALDTNPDVSITLWSKQQCVALRVLVASQLGHSQLGHSAHCCVALYVANFLQSYVAMTAKSYHRIFYNILQSYILQ